VSARTRFLCAAGALAAAALALGVAPAARAQVAIHEPAVEDDLSHPRLTSLDNDDLRFVQKAAADGLAEIELGRLAERKAASDAVRKFGRRVADDHAKANASLKSLAASKRAFLPEKVDADAQLKEESLAKLSGPAFDNAYLERMVSDRQQDVRDFEKRAKEAHDPDVRAFAAKTLATLQEHLKLAQSTK
jgi:putative membrane protein